MKFTVSVQVGDVKETFRINRSGDAPELYAARQAIDSAINHGHGSSRTSPSADRVIVKVEEVN